MLKFLLIGAGKRNQLVELFKKKGILVDCYELNNFVPVKLFCNKIIEGRKWSDDKISNEIINFSLDYNLVLPLMDEATDLLSKLNLVNGCVSNSQTTEICLNKKKFEQFFLDNNKLKFMYPEADSRGYVTQKIIKKPINGFGSKNIKILPRYCASKKSNRYIIQKYIEGKEYSVDCFYDTNNNLIDYVPRERINTCNGEVCESITLPKNTFKSYVEIISKELKFEGPVNMQFVKDKHGKLWIMEINARLGGGATLSIASGFDIIELLLSIFVSKNFVNKNYKSVWKPHVYLQRYMMDYVYEKNSI